MELSLSHTLRLFNIFREYDGKENCAQVLEEELHRMLGIKYVNDEHDCNVVSMNSLNTHDANDMQSHKLGEAMLDEDDILEVEQDAEEEDAQTISQYEQQRSRMNKLPNDTKMVLFEPRSFDEADEIARRLKENKAAVVNLHKLQREYAQRTIDFLTGVIFALDGSIQKIGHNVILCTPNNVPVQGQITLDSGEDE